MQCLMLAWDPIFLKKWRQWGERTGGWGGGGKQWLQWLQAPLQLHFETTEECWSLNYSLIILQNYSLLIKDNSVALASFSGEIHGSG